MTERPLLATIDDPKDLRKLPPSKLPQLASEIREYMIEVLSKIGGHTAASLGPVSGGSRAYSRLDRIPALFDV